MKKQLDTTVMENELRSGSAFFRALPQQQNQVEQAEASSLLPSQEDFNPNAAVPVNSPLDNDPTIKLPKKETNLAPAAPLEGMQTNQTVASPSLRETPQKMEGESTKQTDEQSNDSRTSLALNPPSPPKEETKERINERSLERTDEPYNVKRQKIRHTFDIYADQLLSLKEIQLQRARGLEKVYRLGDLVQEALEAFITKERNKE